MRLQILVSGLSLIIPSFALVAYQPCLTTTALPLVTVIGGQDGYYNQYTRTYREFGSQGLTKKIYTVTQTCSDIDCEAPFIETAPPPGFTQAVVKCSACGGQGTQVATLTFPSESVEAYSSSGYLVEPLDLAQATMGWVHQVNSPQAVETTTVNSDTGMNAESNPAAPGSSDQTGAEPQVPNNGGTQQDQNGNERLGDTSSHHAATDNTGSTNGDDSSNGQNAGGLDGTSSAKGWQSGETGNDSGSGDTPAGSIPQHGPSSPSSSSNDATGSQDQASNIPGNANDPATNNPADPPASGGASGGGEPVSNNNNQPDDTANITSPTGIIASPGDTSVSPDSNSGPPSSQNNSPPVIESDSKNNGNDDESQGPDAPLIVGGASSYRLSITTCIIANAACIFIVWLL